MKLRPSSALLGNLLVAAVLVLLAALLLRLHLQDTWWLATPRPRAWQIAAASVLAYALACLVPWWRNRPREAGGDGSQPPVLVVWASQTGFAQELAQRSAQALSSAGLPVRLRGLHQLDAALLAGSHRALFIASTTGEGDAPDHTLPFLHGLMPAPPSLAHLQYAVLALGDRSYTHFCAFGQQLESWLRQHGAHPLFDSVQVDNADPAALRHWQQLLGQLGGDASAQADWSPAQYQPWQLLHREHLNPGSPGGAVYHLRLQPPAGSEARWQAGDIAEIGPRHAPATVQAWLQAHAIQADPDLFEQLSAARLPASPPNDPQALRAMLQPLPHREYSIASVMADGHLELLLRRQLHADGTPGLASGWLCGHAALGTSIDLRLRRNENFHGVDAATPLLLIGNGTGIAGLRAHLRERANAGATRTWLLFGERTRQHDFHFRDELEALQRQGLLERLDAVFSRDGEDHRYVQHRLLAQGARLQQWVDEGASVLVCGSLQGMAPAVDAVMEQVLGASGLETLRLAGRYRRDVY